MLIASVALAAPLQSGDLVFHRSRSTQAQLLEIVTGSKLGHVGVVIFSGDEPWVLEAVEPVKITPLQVWADRSADGRIAIRRLADADRILTPEVGEKLESLGKSWLGKHYDAKFSWSDDQLYCSELVYKLFHEGAGVDLGTPHPLGDYDLSDPRVRAAAKARFGGKLPTDSLVVAPVDVYEDADLIDVCVGTIDECLD
jgi:hypothetical protein